MRILLCPDKFKGSLTASEVCQALKHGLKASIEDAEVISCPLADGGDGSLNVLGNYLDLETLALEVVDPLGRSIPAAYRRTGHSAFIEVSAASGLALLDTTERSATETSSFGTGQQMAHAIQDGAEEIYLFLGGSATNDGCLGIAEALGYRFYDAKGNRLQPIGGNLIHLDRIQKDHLLFDPEKIEVSLICDVNNPLYGPQGAAHVYADQKGASPEQIHSLDQGLQNLARCLIQHDFPDIQTLAGAGAAGGIGGGGVAFLGGKIKSGTKTFLEISQLEAHIRSADLIITGEGRLDDQTAQGKLISGVAELTQKYQKPLFGVCGSAEKAAVHQLEMQTIYTIMDRSLSLEEAMTKGAEKLREIGLEIGREYVAPGSSDL